jgi:3'-5' exonuclease
MILKASSDTALVANTLLSSLFKSATIIKVGFAFNQGDLAMLKRCSPEHFTFANELNSMVELTSFPLSGRKVPFPSALSTASLHNLCMQWLHRGLNKSERMSNWTHRPLTSSQLTYAALDAHCLLAVVECQLLAARRIEVDKLTVLQHYLCPADVSVVKDMSADVSNHALNSSTGLDFLSSFVKTFHPSASSTYSVHFNDESNEYADDMIKLQKFLLSRANERDGSAVENVFDLMCLALWNTCEDASMCSEITGYFQVRRNLGDESNPTELVRYYAKHEDVDSDLIENSVVVRVPVVAVDDHPTFNHGQCTLTKTIIVAVLKEGAANVPDAFIAVVLEVR